ncbi:MAG: T9SS type A sorting domain-containing protein [Candidatus Hatepunaea meridiana]|nr:T9SS type A sorting domain-containing protein [Candidatus Hatepunaea meridiana]
MKILISIILFLATATIISAQPVIAIDPEEFSFELPHGVRDAGVLNISNNGDSLLIVDVDQRNVRRDVVVRILIWNRYVDIDFELHNMLNSLSELNIGYWVQYYDGIDPDEMADMLDMSHVLIVPEQEDGDENQLHEYGEGFYDVLQQFVSERGGYVIGTDAEGQTAAFLDGAGLIDISVLDTGSDYDCRSVGTHPLNAGIREYEARENCNVHRCRNDDAITIARAVNEDENNITARRIGRGGVVYLGMDWSRYNDEMTQLLINAVMWYRGGSNWLILDPLNGRIGPNDSEDLFFSVESNITPEPGEYSQDIVLLSNDPEQPVIIVPVQLTVTGWQSAELTLEPDELFLITPANVDTTIVVLVRNTGGGFLQANLWLDDPEVDWLNINRENVRIGPGLMDRVLLQFDGEQTEGRIQRNFLVFQYTNPDTIIVEMPIIYYAGDEFGGIEGNIIDAENNNSVSGATVNLHGIRTNSDENGYFSFDNIPASVFNVGIIHPDYLPLVIYDARVRLDQTIRLSPSLRYCVLETDIDEHIAQSMLQNEELQAEGHFRNTGNGNLSYESKFNDIHQVPALTPWEVRSVINSGEMTSSDEIYGAVYTGEYLLLSAKGDRNQPNSIYIIDRNGELIDTIPQPGEFVRGMADLTWDGELVYGTDWDDILGFDLEGETQAVFEGPFLYNRAITWDNVGERFWVADARSDIVAVNRNGVRLDTLENPGLHIYGMGWRNYSEDGFQLYLFCRDGPNNAQIHRMNPQSGEIEFIRNLPTEVDERAGGMSISLDWEPRFLTVITQFTRGANRTVVFNLDRSENWVAFNPTAGVIGPGRSLPVNIEFSSQGLRIGDILEGYFTISAHQRGGIDTILVTLRIYENSAPDYDSSPALLPDEYSLTTYPNPFNGQLNIKYIAPTGIPVQISIYDLEGRLVETLVQTSGIGAEDNISFNGSKIGSGLYFVLLKAGDTRRVSRIVLLK